MMSNVDNGWLDEIRRRTQEALSQAKKEKLRDEYGLEFEYVASHLSPEIENEWLDYLLEFERQFEQAKLTTVRERIGNPDLQPLSDLPLDRVGEALEALLELLAAYGIAVDFLGDVADAEAYRYLTEELLDEEMDDIRIEGMKTHFTYATPEYDVQMWVDMFVRDVFTQDRKYFLPGLASRLFFDTQGEPIPAEQIQQMVESVWERLPATNKVTTKPITTQVKENEGEVWALITWNDKTRKIKGRVKSYFRLKPSPYTGWDVVQTSLLNDLLA
jgi:hypothetical protein